MASGDFPESTVELSIPVQNPTQFRSDETLAIMLKPAGIKMEPLVAPRRALQEHHATEEPAAVLRDGEGERNSELLRSLPGRRLSPDNPHNVHSDHGLNRALVTDQDKRGN